MPGFAEGQDPRDSASTPVGSAFGQPSPNPLAPTPDVSTQLGAAWRQSDVGSVVNYFATRNTDNQFDPDFNPFKEVQGTPLERYASELVGVPNRNAFNAWSARVQQREKDQQILESSGAPGKAASVALGFANPLYYIPVLGEVGMSSAVAERALQFGIQGAMGQAATESVMHSIDPSRSWSESAGNVASAAILQGVLGSAIGFLSPAERAEMAATLDQHRPQVYRNDAGATQVVPQSASAAATDTREMVQKSGALTLNRENPIAVTMASPEIATRRTMGDLATVARKMQQGDEGVTTASTAGFVGDAESKIIHDKLEFLGKQHDILEPAWTNYYYGDRANAPMMAKERVAASAWLADKTGGTIGSAPPEGKLTYKQFGEALFDAMNSGDKSDIPEVEAAAQKVRPLYDRWKTEAQTTLDKDGNPILSPDAGAPKGAQSYMPWIWDKEKITAQTNKFVDYWTSKLKAEQESKVGLRDRLSAFQDGMSAAEKRAADHDAAGDTVSAAMEREKATAFRGKIEDELRGYGGNSAAEARAALAARDKAIAERQAKIDAGEYKGQSARLTSADSHVDLAVKRILGEDLNKSDQELRALAEQIKDHYIGTPDGRLPYDVASGGPDGFRQSEQYRGSLMGRSTWVPYDEIKDWLIRDPDRAAASFARTVIPDIRLTQKFGDVEMTPQMQSIADGYNARIAKLKDDLAAGKITEAQMEKQSLAMTAQRDKDMQAVQTVRDRIRNTLGWGVDLGNFGKWLQLAHSWQSIQGLGTSVINRFADAGLQASFRYGLENVFGDMWGPLVQSAVTLDKAGWAKAMTEQAKDFNVGYEGVLGHARHNFLDAMNYGSDADKMVRFAKAAETKSMLLNMHSQWTDYWKMLNVAVAQGEFGRAAARFAGGKATKHDIQMFADANIPQYLIPRISEQYEKNHLVVGGRKFANVGAWEDGEAREAFKVAMNREANIDVVTAGAGDKPRWISTPIGSMIGQFKGFTFGANERIMIANMQQRDRNALGGIMTAAALGGLSYKMYSIAAGRETSDRPADWAKEAISRSAIAPIFMDTNQIVSKATGGVLDAGRLIGADRPVSRRADNSAASELLGPWWSQIEGGLGITRDIATGNWRAETTSNLRKLAVPMQNWMFTRSLLDKTEDAVNSQFGIKPKERGLPEWQKAH